MNTNKIVLGLDDDVEDLELIREHFDKAEIKNYLLVDNIQSFKNNITDDTRLVIMDHYINGEATAFKLMEEIHGNDIKNNRIIQTKIIIISGQRDVKWQMFYSSHGADYLYKNDLGFFELLVHFVKKNLEDIAYRINIIERTQKIMTDLGETAKKGKNEKQ